MSKSQSNGMIHFVDTVMIPLSNRLAPSRGAQRFRAYHFARFARVVGIVDDPFVSSKSGLPAALVDTRMRCETGSCLGSVKLYEFPLSAFSETQIADGIWELSGGARQR